jgi:long-chain acyl-CoA synthetase
VNLASILDGTALRRPARIALQAGRRAITFAELQRASVAAGTLLTRSGVGPGDHVGLVLPNVPEFAAAYYGILRTGAVAVPLSPASTRPEVASIADDADARRVLVWRHLRWPAVRQADRVLSVAPGSFYDIPSAAPAPGRLIARDAGDTAAILYTSGSSGQPKGVELTHGNLVENARATASLFGYGPADRVLGALPLFHCFGQTCVLNAALLAGATVVLVDGVDADGVDRLLRRGAVSVAVGMPSMFSAIMALDGAEPAPEAGLRLGVSGGAALGADVLRAFEARFDCTVLEGYGLTETSPVASFNRPERRKVGSIGTPIEGVEMKLVDGEIVIRGHNVMKGYWRRPAETAAVLSPDGWLRTGDLGRVEPDGTFYVVGRLSDVIIRDGRNISPAEIEAVLCAHPAVREAAAVGVADPIHGEQLLACVALRPGTEVTEAELAGHLRARLAGDKQPRFVWIVDALPTGPSGKVIKSAIAIPERIRRALLDARFAA